MNLVNKHSRKYEGFVNDKAIGINADSNTVRPVSSSSSTTIALTHVSAQVEMKTKIPSRTHQPARSTHTSSFSASTPSRKLFKSVVNSTAKKGYRADLRAEAVARASAVKASQREKKDKPAPKLRGRKARAAKEE